MSIGTMLFNPFTGAPRHPDDIASDPKGILVWDGEEPLRAYSRPAAPAEPVAAEGELSDATRLSLLNKAAQHRGFKNCAKALASIPLAAEAQKAVAWQVKQKVYKDRAPWVDVDQTTYESAAKYPNKCEVRALGVIGPSASAAAQSAPIERWWRLLLGYGWQNGWDTTSMCLAVADEMRAFAEKNGIRLAAQPGEAE